MIIAKFCSSEANLQSRGNSNIFLLDQTNFKMDWSLKADKRYKCNSDFLWEMTNWIAFKFCPRQKGNEFSRVSFYWSFGIRSLVSETHLVTAGHRGRTWHRTTHLFHIYIPELSIWAWRKISSDVGPHPTLRQQKGKKWFFQCNLVSQACHEVRIPKKLLLIKQRLLHNMSRIRTVSLFM